MKNVMLTLTLTLPGELAEEAGEVGLLTSKSLVSLLRCEIRKRRIDNLFAAIDQLDQQDLKIPDTDDIEAEIAAFRAERRRRALGT